MAWPVGLALALTVTGCTSSGTAGSTPAPAAPATTVTTTAATTQEPRSQEPGIGEPFTLGDAQVTVLAVQDPFPPTHALEPGGGHRLVSVRYEAVRESGVSGPADLPSVELQDASGGTYASEHGRVSVINGGSAPGERLPAASIRSSAVFEIPATATGLRATFRSATGSRTVIVPLD